MIVEQTVVLHQHAFTLGAMPDADCIEQVELNILTTAEMDWHGIAVRHAFIQPYCAQEDFALRLCRLLQCLVAKLKAQQNTDLLAEQSTVYLVLPELGTADGSALNNLIQHIMRSLPGLLQSAQCRVFAYGSAGAIMAFAAAQKVLQQQSQASIWLIAVDSLCSATAFERYREYSANHVLSEGAIALRIGNVLPGNTGEDTGLKLIFSSVDATTGHINNTADDATGNLFRQIAAEVSKRAKTLKLLYMPDCGDERAVSAWLEQYHWLRGAITADTAFCMPAYYCGELGACGGLYRLFHLIRADAKGRLPSLTLQYEQSSQHYRAVALFAVKGMDN